MEFSIAELFIILSLSPEKGRISLDGIHFRYTLTGALLMDYLDHEEFRIEKKRVVPSFRLNGDVTHDYFANRIMKSSGNRRISTWIRRLTNKSRFIFREMMANLEKRRIIRTEHKKFLNLFPYRRYWFIDNSIRADLVEQLRAILLYGKQPGKRETMLLGLIDASKAYQILSRERGESKVMRRKNTDILKSDSMSAGITEAISEVQSAIVASVTAATVAAHSSH